MPDNRGSLADGGGGYGKYRSYSGSTASQDDGFAQERRWRERGRLEGRDRDRELEREFKDMIYPRGQGDGEGGAEYRGSRWGGGRSGQGREAEGSTVEGGGGKRCGGWRSRMREGAGGLGLGGLGLDRVRVKGKELG